MEWNIKQMQMKSKANAKKSNGHVKKKRTNNKK